MSRILNKNACMNKIIRLMPARKKRLVVIGGAVILLVSSVILLWYALWLPALLCLFALAIFCLNACIVRKMYRQIRMFDACSRVRNVDCLIIGDLCQPEKLIFEGVEGNCGQVANVCLSAPQRSLQAAYEILRHTFGILKEPGGRVILVVKKRNLDKQEYSLWDIPIFKLSPTTIKRLKVEPLKRKSSFPLIFAPVQTMKWLMYQRNGCHRHAYHRIICPDTRIVDFCKERELELEVWIN